VRCRCAMQAPADEQVARRRAKNRQRQQEHNPSSKDQPAEVVRPGEPLSDARRKLPPNKTNKKPCQKEQNQFPEDQQTLNRASREALPDTKTPPIKCTSQSGEEKARNRSNEKQSQQKRNLPSPDTAIRIEGGSVEPTSNTKRQEMPPNEQTERRSGKKKQRQQEQNVSSKHHGGLAQLPPDGMTCSMQLKSLPGEQKARKRATKKPRQQEQTVSSKHQPIYIGGSEEPLPGPMPRSTKHSLTRGEQPARKRAKTQQLEHAPDPSSKQLPTESSGPGGQPSNSITNALPAAAPQHVAQPAASNLGAERLKPTPKSCTDAAQTDRALMPPPPPPSRSCTDAAQTDRASMPPPLPPRQGARIVNPPFTRRGQFQTRLQAIAKKKKRRKLSQARLPVAYLQMRSALGRSFLEPSDALILSGIWLATNVLAWHPPNFLENGLDDVLPELPSELPVTYDDPEEYINTLRDFFEHELATDVLNGVQAAASTGKWQDGFVGAIQKVRYEANELLGEMRIVMPDEEEEQEGQPPKEQPERISTEDLLWVRPTLTDEERKEDLTNLGGWFAVVLGIEGDRETIWVRQLRSISAKHGCELQEPVQYIKVATYCTPLRVQCALLWHRASARWLLRNPRFRRRPGSEPSLVEKMTLYCEERKRPAESFHPRWGESKWPTAFKEAIEQQYNLSQCEAIWKCAEFGEGIRLLQGPPGTGKTKTVIAIIAALKERLQLPVMMFAKPILGGKQLPSAGKATLRPPRKVRVLVCTASNCSLDEIVLRLTRDGLIGANGKPWKPQVLRLGDLSKMKQECKVHSLPAASSRAIKADKTAKVKREIVLEQHVLLNTDIVACTLSGAGTDILMYACRKGMRKSTFDQKVSRGGWFDALIIDEATQARELDVLIALQQCAKVCIMVGDHKQLRPTINSVVAEKRGMGISLFEQLVNAGQKPLLLDTQYRMHPHISEMPNFLFYNRALKDGIAEEERIPPPGFSWPSSSRPVALVPVTGEERTHGKSKSIYNRKEAEAVLRFARSLVDAGVAPIGIGIITPYKAQVHEIRELLRYHLLCPKPEDVAVDTVDAFQGQEKEVIIMSCVRTSKRSRCPFLNDARRVNVSLTRAKRGLIVLGHMPTLAHGEVWNRWLRWAQARGLVVPEPTGDW